MIATLKTGEIMEQQTTLLGRANSGIQIAKLIQWLCLNFPLQNNQIGCRGNLLPESQFYRRYFSPKVSFIRSYANFATYFCQESIFKKYLDSAKIIKDRCIPGLVCLRSEFLSWLMKTVIKMVCTSLLLPRGFSRSEYSNQQSSFGQCKISPCTGKIISQKL